MPTLKQVDTRITKLRAAIKEAKHKALVELRYGKSILAQCRAILKYHELNDDLKSLKRQRKTLLA